MKQGTNEYILNKLQQCFPEKLKHLLSYMKDKGGMYIAGGAITCIATNKTDQINDWDCFFPSKESCIEAIRFMKEDNPHVAFVSDKSITYKLSSSDTIQFVYNGFYPEAKDIFETFDFTVVMGAYDCRDSSLYFHENFWMHNAQRFLSVNTGTSFPILSLLRLEKYRSRGYKFSRNEYLKLALTVANLNITTWEEAKEQIGNTYGFTLADFNGCAGEEFSIEKLIERIESITDGDEVPYQDHYLYPHNAVDFLLEGKPIEYVKIKDQKQYIDPLVLEAEDGVQNLIERGLLEEVEIDKTNYLSKDYYVITDADKNVGDVVNTNYYNRGHLYTKENLSTNSFDKGKVIYKVSFSVEQVNSIFEDYLECSSYRIEERVCRVEHLKEFREGNTPEYRENAKMTSDSVSPNGWAFKENEDFQKGKISQLKEMRQEHIKNNVIVIDKTPRYAHNTFKGIILEGGEDITAIELLYYMDDWNLCFGGSLTIKEDGTFSGRYNTD